MRVKVLMRDTGADQPVVVKKSRNGDGAKGLDRSALRMGQLRGLEEEPTSKAKTVWDLQANGMGGLPMGEKV